MKNTNTVNDKPMSVLLREHLDSGKSITSIEAQALWRCRSLTKRISELRRKGMNIKADWRNDSTGQRYVRYIRLD